MEINIRAGQRILYKDGNSGWLVGVIDHGKAEINELGLWLPIIPIRFATMDPADIPYIQWAEINSIFTDVHKVEDWMRYNLVKKEDYIQFIESEAFERNLENAWVSDGEYYYYPISTYTEKWIRRQPFNYIIRNN